MKKLFSLLLLTMAFGTAYSQMNHVIQNDSIQYKIILQTRSVKSKEMHPNGYYVLINMNDSDRRKLICQNFEFWDAKLTNESSDWAAIVTLYFLYSKEATFIWYLENNKNKWPVAKDKEITYWKNFFANKTTDVNCNSVQSNLSNGISNAVK
jgi:hypothetical protein